MFSISSEMQRTHDEWKGDIESHKNCYLEPIYSPDAELIILKYQKLQLSQFGVGTVIFLNNIALVIKSVGKVM